MLEKNSISLQAISCVRGNTGLFSNLNFSAKNGDLIHILGENGSGKTSLLRIIAGIALADSGQVLWNEVPIKKSDSFAHNISYLAHRDGIKLEFTAIENLSFYQKLYGEKDETKIFDCLEALDIHHIAFNKANELSFGQRRRLGFARLLLSPTNLWLLDEPFTGIDIHGRHLLEQICLNFLDKGGIIIMTHHAEMENKTLAKRTQAINLSEFLFTNEKDPRATKQTIV